MWIEEFVNYNYSEHAWLMRNCTDTPGSYAIAWGTSAVTKPLNISFDPCIWAKMFATFFQLNLIIVFTKIWISNLTMTIHHRRRRHHHPPHHHRTLLSQSLLNLSPMRSTSGSFKPCGPKLLEELGGYSARDFPKLRRKEFLATNFHFAHNIFGISSDFPPSIWEGGSLVSTKSLIWLFIEDLFVNNWFLQAYLHLQSSWRCLCGAGPLHDGHATEIHGAQAHTTDQVSTARIRWLDLVVSTFFYLQSALNGIFLSAR